MSSIDILLERGDRRERHPRTEAAAPAMRTAVVTCMDARIDPPRVLGLQPGDAHVIRNAGAVVTDDVIRSLALSQRELGTREVMVIAHTGCGLLGLADERFHAELRREAGSDPAWRAGAFADLDEHVRAGVRLVRGSPFVPHRDHVRGFVYDLAGDELLEVTT